MKEENYISKVDYVSLSDSFQRKQDDDLKRIIDYLAKEAALSIEEDDGFLKLQYKGDNNNKVVYYNHKILGMVNDFASPFRFVKQSVNGVNQKSMELTNREQMAVVCHLDAGIMSAGEFDTVFRSKEFDRICRKFQWPDVSSLVFAVVEPFGFCDRFRNGISSDEVYTIPIYRCVDTMGITAGMAAKDVVLRLMRHGFLPDSEDSRKLMENRDFLEGFRDFANQTNHAENRIGNAEGLVNKAEEKDLKTIKEYFCESCERSANISPYDETIFQFGNGSWDLYRFVGLTSEDLDPSGNPWFEVSDSNLYARNPCMDIVSDSEKVAIDFGTKSTTVAVCDRGGNISFLPVGSWDDFSKGEKRYENPTIMKFSDFESFIQAYQAQECRPNTKFDDISVSHPALEDFEKMNSDKNMLQYLTQLKQWVNNPHHMLYVCDGKGKVVSLSRYDSQDENQRVDPIELYAYYIGLYINNMHRGKIYLKYLLSYSSTYLVKSCEQIRSSFEKGLKKSLPAEVLADQEAMNGFEVKLWQDEAAAYAVCALDWYLREDFNQADGQRLLKMMQKNGSLYYGVYDFGGGTLDFSFGQFTREEGEADTLTQLECGGASKLGCENILEELAFSIFSENREEMIRNNIKCNKPFRYGALGGSDIVASSNEARFNTCSMIESLRNYWIGEEETKGRKGLESLLLINQKGEKYKAELSWGEATGNEPPNKGTIKLKVEKQNIEEFFRKKIEKGVNLFFQAYFDVIKKSFHEGHKQPCVIFLAGNACKSFRVKECFENYLKENKRMESFFLIPPLPTKHGEELIRKSGGESVPTAKSGVAYGLLLSRPGANSVKIVNQMKKTVFHYHLGYQKQLGVGLQRIFCLAVKANEMPEEGSCFRRICRIDQTTMNLLYTDNSEYALKSESPDEGDIYRVQLVLDQKYVGEFLYCCAQQSSDVIMKLGVSREDEETVEHVDAVIGICDFSETNRVYQPLDT